MLHRLLQSPAFNARPRALGLAVSLLDSGSRAFSSVGRAPARQAGGHWFEPSNAHLVVGTYAAALAVCGASLAIGQAAVALCGVRRVVVALAGGRAGAALRALLGDGAAAGGRDGSRRSPSRRSRSPRSPSSGGGWRVGGRRSAPAGRSRSRPRSPPRCRSSSKATSGSSAPASTRTCPSTCWRPTGSPTARAPSSSTRATRSVPTRSSSRSARASASVSSRASAASRSRSPSSPRSPLSPPSPIFARRAERRGPGGRPRLHGRLLLRPGRLQGDDAGPLRPRLRPRPPRGDPATWLAKLPLRFVPAALIAVGSVYTYSFPGLIWLIGAALIWAVAESVAVAASICQRAPVLSGSPPSSSSWSAPEIGRMIDFHSFETFDPNGPGLGNLFGQVSPFEALGIWPSGDFRLAPGDGAVPAAGYYLGAAFALALLLHGLVRCWRRRESAILAGLAAVAARLRRRPRRRHPLHRRQGDRDRRPARSTGHPPAAAPVGRRGRSVATVPRNRLAATVAAALFVLAAGACSLLALANAPVGPTSYSPALTGLRPLVAAGSTLVLASPQLLERGTRRALHRLGAARRARLHRGRSEAAGAPPPSGVRFVVTEGSAAQAALPGPPRAPRRPRPTSSGKRPARPAAAAPAR